MKIRYKNKQVNFNLFLGLIWLANGIRKVGFNENVVWYDYFWFILSALYLITYFYKKKEQYLTIENGMIKQNWPYGKTMNLNEVKRIQHFAGEYTLKSEFHSMKINIDAIKDESLSKLRNELKKLDVEWR